MDIDSDQRWIDNHHQSHNIADMSNRYRVNCRALLERGYRYVASHRASECMEWPAGGDMAQLAADEAIDYYLDVAYGDRDMAEFLETVPVYRALRDMHGPPYLRSGRHVRPVAMRWAVCNPNGDATDETLATFTRWEDVPEPEEIY